MGKGQNWEWGLGEAGREGSLRDVGSSRYVVEDILDYVGFMEVWTSEGRSVLIPGNTEIGSMLIDGLNVGSDMDVGR